MYASWYRCVCVCMIVGASLTSACYVGQVSVCIQVLKRGSLSPNTEEHGAMLKPTLRSVELLLWIVTAVNDQMDCLETL